MLSSSVANLAASSALSGTELFYSDNLSADVKVTANQIRTFAQTFPGATSGTATLQASAITGSAVITLPSATASLLSTAGATLQTHPSNPTGNATATIGMAGLNQTITPVMSTRLFIAVNGIAINSAASGGVLFRLQAGTGAAPTNGAASSGTLITGNLQQVTATAAAPIPFSASGIMTVVPGTTYWIDMGVANINSGTASIQNLTVTAYEV